MVTEMLRSRGISGCVGLKAGRELISFAKRYYKALIIIAGLAILYRHILYELAQDWWNDPDYSHGLVLPFVTLWLIWRRKDKLAALPVRPTNLGLLFMGGGLLVFFVGDLGAELFSTRVSLLIFLAGLILFLFGWKHLQMLAFPVGLLILAIPLPAVIFYQITFPLQILASKLGSFLLETSRVPVLREGNVIVLPSISLEVAEACSGVRSLFTLLTLTILYGYLMEEGFAGRLVLVALTIPLALFCNGLRIMGTGILTQYVSPEAAEGFFHTFSGWFIFIIALITLMAVHKGFGWLRLAPVGKEVKDGATEHSFIPT